LARRVIEQMLAHPLTPGALINVNIPPLERGPVRGIRVVPQNVVPYLEQFDRRTDPRGRVYFWTTPGVSCPDPHPDTDEEALSEHYITVTPLQFNLTHHAQLDAMQRWDWRLDDKRP
jgi:5'-nucleotidase